MNFLAALGGVQSVLGAINGTKAGERLARQGQATMQSGLDISRAGYDQMLRRYQDSLSSGQYDPEKALQQTSKEAAFLNDIERGNVGARLRGMGFKNGDSTHSQQQRQIGQRSRLALQRQMIDIANTYRQMQNADLGNVHQFGNQYAQLANQSGNQTYNQGMAMKQMYSPGAVLGGLASMGVFEDPTKKK